MADTVSRVDIFRICCIRAPGNLLLPQPVLNLLSAKRQERPDPLSPDRANAAQALQSGPARNIKEYGLCIIISVVGRGDLRSAVFPAHRLKRLPPDSASRLL